MNLKEGHVLWLKLPFGKTDEVSTIHHPYLVIGFTKDKDILLVEIGQLDSYSDIISWDSFRRDSIAIRKTNPEENVIYKDSYLQTDRKYKIQYFENLIKYIDTTDTLSEIKFKKAVNAYYSFRGKNEINEYRELTFTQKEIEELNPYEEWLEAQAKRFTKYGVMPESTNEIINNVPNHRSPRL